MRARPFVLFGNGLAAAAALLAAGVVADRQDGPSARAEVIAKGQDVYEADCAACHGAQLEGQPDWRSSLPSGRLPAPPHDASGHTWNHPDDVLLRIVKEGTAAVVGNGYESDMPGFGDVLTDAEIGAALAYIKSKWPERERIYQEQASGVSSSRWWGGKGSVPGRMAASTGYCGPPLRVRPPASRPSSGRLNGEAEHDPCAANGRKVRASAARAPCSEGPLPWAHGMI